LILHLQPGELTFALKRLTRHDFWRSDKDSEVTKMLEGHDPCHYLHDQERFETELEARILKEVKEANKEQDERIGRRMDGLEKNIKDFMQNGFYKKLLNDTMAINRELIQAAMQSSFGIKSKKIDLWKTIGLALLGAFGVKLLDLLSALAR